MMLNVCIILNFIVLTLADVEFEADWQSIDSRPLPEWYDEAKIGIFIHWGVYSVPSFKDEWFWLMWKDRDDPDITEYMQNNYPKKFTYQEFAKDFTAEFYNATKWAALFADSGARYVVLTSKHHEGYTLWPSNYSFSWNAMDVGPHRDLLGELATAIKSYNLHFGVYYSLLEWYNPLYIAAVNSNFTDDTYYKNKVAPELKELVETYQPEIIWTDGEWDVEDWYWHATEFLAWLYNESPVKDTVVANDRWGSGTLCKHGGFYTCADRYNPGVVQSHKWENAMTIDKKSWGFRREADLSEYLTSKELISTLIVTVSCGGNILINVGPAKDGTITPIYEERLRDLGAWLSINGEAIYGTSPWTIQNDTNAESSVWYTQNSDAVYAISLKWPEDNYLVLESVYHMSEEQELTIYFLESKELLQWTRTSNSVNITPPNKATVKGQHAWTVKITY